MPAVAVAAAVVGAAATVAGVATAARGVRQQRRAAREQERRFQEQQDAAREAARLERTRTESGARVRLGAPGSDRGSGDRTRSGAASRTGTVENAIGGLGGDNRGRYGI